LIRTQAQPQTQTQTQNQSKTQTQTQTKTQPQSQSQSQGQNKAKPKEREENKETGAEDKKGKSKENLYSFDSVPDSSTDWTTGTGTGTGAGTKAGTGAGTGGGFTWTMDAGGSSWDTDSTEKEKQSTKSKDKPKEDEKEKDKEKDKGKPTSPNKGKSENTDGPRIVGWTIDTILCTWREELEQHVKSFMQQAAQIKQWDQKLFEKSSEVIQLQKDVAGVFEAQKLMDSTLEKIKTQQQTMATTLTQVESGINNAMQEIGGFNIQTSEMKARSDVYKTAETVNDNLNSLHERLQNKIKQLNEDENSSNDADPVSTIVKILNNHMQSLQWIEKKSKELADTVNQIDGDLKNIESQHM